MGQIDAAYRRLFGHAVTVRDLMACALPTTLFHALDWGGMRAVPTHYVSDRLKKRSGDIAWLIPYRRGPGQPPQPRDLCVLLLLEHQSTSDATMSLRAAVYTGLAYQSLLRNQDIEPPLPPVLPVVLYSGDRPWRASRDMSGLVAAVPGDLRPYQLQMRYLLIEERSLLRASGLPDTNLAALLFRMGSHRDIEQWRALLHTVMQATQGPEFKELKRSITAWLLLMAQSNAGLSEALPVVNSLEELDMMISEKPGIWAQQWKLEGKQEGIREGQADLLLRLIERRFGAVPDAVTQRIHDADESALTLWSLNVLDAATLEDVFSD